MLTTYQSGVTQSVLTKKRFFDDQTLLSIGQDQLTIGHLKELLLSIDRNEGQLRTLGHRLEQESGNDNFNFEETNAELEELSNELTKYQLELQTSLSKVTFEEYQLKIQDLCPESLIKGIALRTGELIRGEGEPGGHRRPP